MESLGISLRLRVGSWVLQLTSPRAATPRGACPLPDLQSGPSQSSLLTSSPISPRGLPEAIPFQGLELGYVLGRGAFGSVFQGTYNGRPVAVKVRPAPCLGKRLLCLKSASNSSFLHLCCGSDWTVKGLNVWRSAWQLMCSHGASLCDHRPLHIGCD